MSPKEVFAAVYGPTWEKARGMWITGASLKQIGEAIGRTESSVTALITSRRKIDGVDKWPYRPITTKNSAQSIKPIVSASPLLTYRCECGCVININVSSCRE